MRSLNLDQLRAFIEVAERGSFTAAARELNLTQLKSDHPQLEINLKAGLTTTTLQMLKTNALDLGLCALPIEDPAFETVPLFHNELVAILPAKLKPVPKK